MTLLISMLADDEIAVVMDSYGTNAPAGDHFTKCWAARGGALKLGGGGAVYVVAPGFGAVGAGPHHKAGGGVGPA
ncbi:hypothetical protein, partial [Nocardia brasiliensis]|uniref:hypothetical protein n=1 Tax=Nocardia brasiliensis TaxID=37326 RepID=UPI002457EA47